MFLCRSDIFPVFGNNDDASTECVVHGSHAREGCVWCVLPGRGALPVLLMAFSHCLLPF